MGEYESHILDGGNEISHGRKSRRRARMGEGAYSEKSYDALLKLQQQEFECGDEWEKNEEWEEATNYEEDWGEEAWREVKQEEEEGVTKSGIPKLKMFMRMRWRM